MGLLEDYLEPELSKYKNMSKRPKTTSNLQQQQQDIDAAVNPEHYKDNAFGQELINVIEQSMTREQFTGYCRGNAIKYRMRAGKKSDKIEQDIKKALWYEDKLKSLTTLPF
jgi:hypothetical protein